MVVLDEHRVEETDAMIDAAPDRDRVLLERPPSGGGLAGVDELDAEIGDPVDEPPRLGGDPRESPEKVQRGALGREDRGVAPRDP